MLKYFKQKINNFKNFCCINSLYLILVILNVSLLFQFIKVLLQYHLHLLEFTPYNVGIIFFMTSTPIIVSSILLYCAGKNSEFRRIFLSIIIAISIVFIVKFILDYFFKDILILLPYVWAQWKLEDLLLSTPGDMRPSKVVTPNLNNPPGYIAENISYLSTPHFIFSNGIYTITGELGLNLQGIFNGTHSAQPFASHLVKALEHTLAHSNWGGDTQSWNNHKEKFSPLTQQFMDHYLSQQSTSAGHSALNSIAFRNKISKLV